MNIEDSKGNGVCFSEEIYIWTSGKKGKLAVQVTEEGHRPRQPGVCPQL